MRRHFERIRNFGSDGNFYGVGYGGGPGPNQTFVLPLPPPQGWGTGPTPSMALAFNKPTLQLSQGHAATLSWKLTNTGQCELTAKDSAAAQIKNPAVSANGKLRLRFTKPGTFGYSLSCANNGTQAWTRRRATSCRLHRSIPGRQQLEQCGYVYDRSPHSAGWTHES